VFGVPVHLGAGAASWIRARSARTTCISCWSVRVSCWALQLTTVSSPPRTSPRSLKWPAVVFEPWPRRRAPGAASRDAAVMARPGLRPHWNRSPGLSSLRRPIHGEACPSRWRRGQSAARHIVTLSVSAIPSPRGLPAVPTSALGSSIQPLSPLRRLSHSCPRTSLAPPDTTLFTHFAAHRPFGRPLSP